MRYSWRGTAVRSRCKDDGCASLACHGYTAAMTRRDDHADGDQLAITRHAAADAGLPLRLGGGQLLAPGGVAGNHHGVVSCMHGADGTVPL